MKKTIGENKIVQYILWLISSTPLFMLFSFRYIFFDKEFLNINYKILSRELDFSIPKPIGFILLIPLTILLFWGARKAFFKMIKNKIIKSSSNQKIRVYKYDKLSLDEYSFFIMSLMLPFIFEDFNNLYALLTLLILVFIIIAILVKMEKIILNPIFLFSNIKIFRGEIIKIGGNNLKIKCYIVTKASYEALEQGNQFFYEEYFKNVYFLIEEK